MDVSSPGPVAIGNAAPPAFSLLNFLFSARGRVNRAKMWAFTVAQMVIVVIMEVITNSLGPDGEDVTPAKLVVAVVFVVLALATFYPSIVIAVKRLHDRNRSGWFFLVTLIPIVNLWIYVEMFFLRGTRGENRFGPENGEAVGKALVETFQ